MFFHVNGQLCPVFSQNRIELQKAVPQLLGRLTQPVF